MSEANSVINHTKNWINDVVVGLNFCPFASKEVRRGTIHFEVISEAELAIALESLSNAFLQLDENKSIETTLIIFPHGFASFDDYLELIAFAEDLLVEMEYEGVYQIASFHPDYLFAGSSEEDPANYTNRSPYPMLHVLREESLSAAIDSHPDTDSIPERNIELARKMGLKQMMVLREACFKTI